MASPANPMLGGGQLPPQLLSLVMGALSGKTGGAPGAAPGERLGERMAGAQGADPTMVLRQLEQVNNILGVLFVKTFQSLPNIANQISATMKALSRAIKEGQQAANVGEAVAGGTSPSPITFGPAQQGESSAPTGPAPAI